MSNTTLLAAETVNYPQRLPIDITGQRFTRLVALRPNAAKHADSIHWTCLCDCGKTALVSTHNLLVGKTKSCGCLKTELIITRNLNNAKHRQCFTRAYRTWSGMKRRCLNPQDAGWKRYGGRGITICPEWMDFTKFHADMGDPPDGYSLHRINNDGDYSPQNCVWASPETQTRNRSISRNLTYQGQTLSILEWCKKLGLNYGTIIQRVGQGWTAERALTRPVHKGQSVEDRRGLN